MSDPTLRYCPTCKTLYFPGLVTCGGCGGPLPHPMTCDCADCQQKDETKQEEIQP